MAKPPVAPARPDGRVIDFHFDFISPYGYFAAMQIEDLARRHGYLVRWHAFRLGVAVVKVMGLRPLMETPMKSEYVLRDIARLALVYALPIAVPLLPPDPVFLGSAFYVVEARYRDLLPAFTKRLYQHIWGQGQAVHSIDQLQRVARSAGIDGAAPFSAAAMATGRARLDAATRSSIGRGIFGSPTFVAGNEAIWGVDRLWMLEHFLSKQCQWSRYSPRRQGRP
jgi:2-hydroxychromene-2-carboxylate isomerase